MNISSSLTTVFYAGPREVAEAAMEKWSEDCFSALNTGLDIVDSEPWMFRVYHFGA